MTKRQRQYWAIVAEAQRQELELTKPIALGDGTVELLAEELQTKKLEKLAALKTKSKAAKLDNPSEEGTNISNSVKEGGTVSD